MKENNSRKYLIGLLLIISVGIVLCGCIIFTDNSKDWSGTYKNTFTLQKERNEPINERFIPTIEIQDEGQILLMEIHFKTTIGPINDTGIGTRIVNTYYAPVQVSKQLLKKNYIFCTKPSILEEEVYTYFEIKYQDGENIQFRYANSEKELHLQEFYVLKRTK